MPRVWRLVGALLCASVMLDALTYCSPAPGRFDARIEDEPTIVLAACVCGCHAAGPATAIGPKDPAIPGAPAALALEPCRPGLPPEPGTAALPPARDLRETPPPRLLS